MKKIGIIGLGLIGGSIAKAVKRRYPDVVIAALNRRDTSLKQAFDEKIIDLFSTSDFSIFSGCDMIFLCTPVDRIPSFVEKLSDFIDKNCILTDVGSTKKKIYDKMAEYDNVTFIGGHPMAGSEKIGYSYSDADLLRDCVYIITPYENTASKDIDRLLEILDILNAKPTILDAAYHDRLVAASSHCEHVISASITNAAAIIENDDSLIHLIAAGGFRDVTRISSSSPDMWTSICVENKKEILNVISVFKQQLSEFENALLNEDSEKINDFFASAKSYRDTFDFK